MYLQKVISRKTFLEICFLFGILKVDDENSRVRIQDPDPLVRGMDSRIQIHTKMSWIRNTAFISHFYPIPDSNPHVFASVCSASSV
jgi:hypothetical protein